MEDEFVVVQGVADLVVLLPEEIWLVDFKTDEIAADELPEKKRLYEPQLKLYAQRAGKNLFAAGHRALAAFSVGPENGLSAAHQFIPLLAAEVDPRYFSAWVDPREPGALRPPVRRVRGADWLRASARARDATVFLEK